MPDGGSVGDRLDFEFGPLRVRPMLRLIEGTSGSVSVEPLVMQLLVTLSRRAGKLVTRGQAFEACWGGAAVGDDSLNRLVAVLRKALRHVASEAVQIETIAGAGYVLRLAATGANAASADSEIVRGAIEAAYDSWRAGLPEPDHLRLEQLRRVSAEDPDDPRTWGMLALLCRQAAEYADPADVPGFVSECEAAARRALTIDSGQAEALVARASVAPLFGRWLHARTALTNVLERTPDHTIALHDLAILEMATGRVRAAKAIIDSLMARDPLAACFWYKSIYQHWSVGDLAGLDAVADRAIQLWPRHPAVWSARFWTLANTGRGPAALKMLEDGAARPPMPEPALRLLKLVVSAHTAGDAALGEQAARACSDAAARGPAQALGALNGLGLLGRVDEAFSVAGAYYHRAGAGPVPLRHTNEDPSINDQHRRVTQMLFTPAGAAMRSDPRFLPMCERMGLVVYWEQTGLAPDFLDGSPAA